MRKVTIEISPSEDEHIDPCIMVAVRIDGRHHADAVVDNMIDAAAVIADIIARIPD